MKEKYKIIEIAKRYGVATITVYKWLETGKLNGIVTFAGLARRYIIKHHDLLEFESKYGIQPVA